MMTNRVGKELFLLGAEYIKVFGQLTKTSGAARTMFKIRAVIVAPGVVQIREEAHY